MKKTLALMVMSLMWGSFFVVDVQAEEVLYQQAVADSRGEMGLTSTITLEQKIGTGLTGVLSAVVYTVYATTTIPTAASQLVFYECTTNVSDVYGAGTCTALFSKQYYGSLSAGYTNITASSSSNVLDPTKYYYFLVQDLGSGGVNHQWPAGSSANTWSGGSCINPDIPIRGDCSSVSDLAFKLMGAQTVTDLPYVRLISPAQATTSTSTVVRFNFNYHNVTGYNYTQYILRIWDTDSALLSIATSSVDVVDSIVAGDGSVDRYITLSRGHIYNYAVYLCTSLGLFGNCTNSAKFTFAVVDGTVEQAIYDYALIASGLSTSTTGTGGEIGSAIRGVVNSISGKIPFAYFVALVGAWNNVTADATSSLPILDIGLDSLGYGSTTPMGNILPDIRLDEDAIMTYLPQGVYDAMYALQGIAFYLMLAWYFWKRVPSLFRMA